MLSFWELFTVAASLTVAGVAMLVLPRHIKAGVVAAISLAVLMFGFSQPSLAGAAAPDKVLNQQQRELNENLQTAPQGTQYQGLEYADEKGTPLSDLQIEQRIQSKIPDGIKLSVSNGSVRISGRAKNRRDAQRIVQDIKEVPGVHEVSFDLGLDEKA